MKIVTFELNTELICYKQTLKNLLSDYIWCVTSTGIFIFASLVGDDVPSVLWCCRMATGRASSPYLFYWLASLIFLYFIVYLMTKQCNSTVQYNFHLIFLISVICLWHCYTTLTGPGCHGTQLGNHYHRPLTSLEIVVVFPGHTMTQSARICV